MKSENKVIVSGVMIPTIYEARIKNNYGYKMRVTLIDDEEKSYLPIIFLNKTKDELFELKNRNVKVIGHLVPMLVMKIVVDNYAILD